MNNPLVFTLAVAASIAIGYRRTYGIDANIDPSVYKGVMREHLVGYWPLDSASEWELKPIIDSSHKKIEKIYKNARYDDLKFTTGPFGKAETAITVKSFHPQFATRAEVESAFRDTGLTVAFWFRPDFDGNSDSPEITSQQATLFSLGQATSDQFSNSSSQSANIKTGDVIMIKHSPSDLSMKLLVETVLPRSEGDTGPRTAVDEIAFEGDAPHKWQFYAFTWHPGNEVRTFKYTTPIATIVARPRHEIRRLDPSIGIAALAPLQTLACLSVFDMVLTQTEIAALPQLCKLRSNTLPIGYKLEISKNYTGPQEKRLLAYFPLDPSTDQLFEMTSGLTPVSFSAAKVMLRDRTFITLPIDDNEWSFEFNLDDKNAPSQFTLSFYLFCDGYNLEPMVLFGWNSQPAMNIFLGQKCSSLLLRTSNKKDPLRAFKIRVKAFTWIMFTIRYKGATVELISHKGSLRSLPMKVKFKPTSGLNFRIGPNRKIALVAVRCVSIWDVALTDQEIKLTRCHCPSTVSDDPMFPYLLVNAPGCDYLDPIVNAASFYALLDIQNGFTNLAGEVGVVNSNAFLYKTQSHLTTPDYTHQGTTAGLETSTTVIANSFSQVFKVLKHEGDFTLSYMVQLANGTVGDNVDRVLLDLVDDNDVMKRLKVSNLIWKKMLVGEQPGSDSPQLFTTTNVPTSQWCTLAFTYSKSDNNISIWKQCAGEWVRNIFSVGKTDDDGLAFDKMTVKAAFLWQADQIRCISFHKRELESDEIEALTRVCKRRGQRIPGVKNVTVANKNKTERPSSNVTAANSRKGEASSIAARLIISNDTLETQEKSAGFNTQSLNQYRLTSLIIIIATAFLLRLEEQFI